MTCSYDYFPLLFPTFKIIIVLNAIIIVIVAINNILRGTASRDPAPSVARCRACAHVPLSTRDPSDTVARKARFFRDPHARIGHLLVDRVSGSGVKGNG